VKFELYPAETKAFPEYYEEYMKRAMMGGTVAPVQPLFAVAPVTYIGADELKRDLANLRKAVDAVKVEGAFVPSTAPSGVGRNEYYKNDEEFFYAVADAMRTEYAAIVEAGFDLQVDDPFLSDIFGDPKLDETQRVKKADMYVGSINHGLRGLPADRIRFHTCYGINHGPRVFEPQLRDVIRHIYKINAGIYSFEAANARHEHDYHAFETYKLPEGKAIMPGVITHAINIVEHPELVAEWLVRWANLVGRDNVIAGADCGFSSQACYHTEVHPTIIWTKFKAMADGARRASDVLWGRKAAA
jgi:5-methyltetrahydropteroyltriglutamate--homocysteine methyltransferase